MDKSITLCGGKKKYDIINFMKGFSILTIVLMHLIQSYIKVPNVILKASSFGGTGVHVFFFCSGFGLFISQRNIKLTFRQFIRKRFVKIYVPYIFVILISSLFPFMFKGNTVNAVLSHVFLYKMFVPHLESSFGGQMWYMSTIIQFYFIFLPLCWFKDKIESNAKFCMTCFALSMGWWIFTALVGITEIRIWGSFFLQYLWEFALGISIADYLSQGHNVEFNTRYLWGGAIAGLSLAAVAAVKGGPLRTFNDIPALLGYGSAAMLLYSMRWHWIDKSIYFLSKISYEWYLVYILIFECIFRMFSLSGVGQYLLAIIAFVMSIFIAVLYKKLLETFWKKVK